jgi:hypothetical protein
MTYGLKAWGRKTRSGKQVLQIGCYNVFIEATSITPKKDVSLAKVNYNYEKRQKELEKKKKKEQKLKRKQEKKTAQPQEKTAQEAEKSA